MSSSPEHRPTATALIEEPSPQVNHPQLEKGPLAETEKPPLPAGLLGSSPEIGNTGQTAANAPTQDGQPITTVEPTVAVPPAPFTNITQQPRHHDDIMDRNEKLEDELWTAMSREHAAFTVENTQESRAIPSPLGEPGPGEPSSRGQLLGTRPAEFFGTFRPPGGGRTPAQRAAAEELEALVSARTRQREEAGRVQHRQLPTPTHGTVDINDDSHAQPPAPGGHRIYDWRQEQVQDQHPPAFSGGVPGFAGQAQMPMQTQLFPDLQTNQQPSEPAPSQPPLHVSGLQRDSNDGSPRQLGENSGHTVQSHLGDSIFNQMINDLIANDRAENIQHHQIQLPSGRPIPFGMEFLYYGEWIGPQHRLYSRARRRWSVMREVRSARNGEIVGWHDSESCRPGGVHLCPTENRGRWDPAGSQSGEPSGGQRRRR